MRLRWVVLLAFSATLANAQVCGKECFRYLDRVGFQGQSMYPQRDGFEGTAPVGSFPAGASPFGVMDLIGNVSEWLADEYAGYDAGSVADPPPVTTDAAADQKHYNLRGGSWLSAEPQKLRAAYRGWNLGAVRDMVNGFRCARAPL